MLLAHLKQVVFSNIDILTHILLQKGVSRMTTDFAVLCGNLATLLITIQMVDTTTFTKIVRNNSI